MPRRRAGTACAAYGEFAFSKVVGALLHLVHTDLSAFYFEVVKDRVYLEPRHGAARLSALTAMHTALVTLTRTVAPIAPFMAEVPGDLMGGGVAPRL